MKLHRHVIGLGANLGARLSALHLAQGLLRADPALEVVALSPVYESPPVGPPQPDYLNAALLARSHLGSEQLLLRLQAIEATLGRQRLLTWGPRTLDLDLLWSDDPVERPSLQVPHARLRDRWWALRPMLDVAPFLSAVYGPDLTRLTGASPPRAGLDFGQLSCPWSRAPGSTPGVASYTARLPVAEGERLDRLVGCGVGLAAGPVRSTVPGAADASLWAGVCTATRTWPTWQAWAQALLLLPQAGKWLLGAHASATDAGLRGVLAWRQWPGSDPVGVDVELDDVQVSVRIDAIPRGIGYH